MRQEVPIFSLFFLLALNQVFVLADRFRLLTLFLQVSYNQLISQPILTDKLRMDPLDLPTLFDIFKQELKVIASIVLLYNRLSLFIAEVLKVSRVLTICPIVKEKTVSNRVQVLRLLFTIVD